jgi:hypothetical protein
MYEREIQKEKEVVEEEEIEHFSSFYCFRSEECSLLLVSTIQSLN